MKPMKGIALQFTKPGRVELCEEDIRNLRPHEAIVQTIVSAISPGTELLIYKGKWPENVSVDESIPALAGRFRYPLKYGYAAVGRVISVGAETDPEWLNRLVFTFHPHASLFAVSVDLLVPVPETVSPEAAGFLPNMETAVGFLQDGRPMIGENVVVFGQGIVGLLTTALLGSFPLGSFVTFDRYPLRREKSFALGAHLSEDPLDLEAMARVWDYLRAKGFSEGADLVYELSGNPKALDQAIDLAGYSGRIVIGSWYGGTRCNVDLGGRFHRGRIHIVSSQVSKIAPEHTGLWSKRRRLQVALGMLERIQPETLITHRFHISDAAQAYALLCDQPELAVQVLLTYEDTL